MQTVCTGQMKASPDHDSHLHLPGLPADYARLADAHLVVEGVPIHKCLLAVWSPVFSDLFLLATPSTTEGMESFPLPGHTVADICTSLKFLYKRTTMEAAETPSKNLWQSIEDARPIVQFVHKFNMRTILQEFDTCLARQAAASSERIFMDDNSIVAWAALAEECGLKTLLAHAELFMVKIRARAFWQSPAFDQHKLSNSCMRRMLQAAQLHMNDWNSKFSPGACQDDAWAQSHCRSCNTKVWCTNCARLHPERKPIVAHASLSRMISWQQSSVAGAHKATSSATLT